jgi:GT2 family glycosyltransferase
MAEQVSIITTTYRSHIKLNRCLNTVRENTKYVDYKHYVWCNDPDDKVKGIIHDALYIGNTPYNDRVVPVYNDSNSGTFSSNNNELVNEAEGKYILLLNDDTEPLIDSWLYGMVRVLESDLSVGAVGALLLYPDRKVQHCGVFFSARTNDLPFHLYYRQPLDRVQGFVSQYRYYQAVTAACLLMRKEDYLAVGGLSTDFSYGFEDVDLCLKLKIQLKKSCVYCPDAQLIHNEGCSGTFKSHPHLQDNIAAFRKNCTGKYFHDELFYLSNPNYMLYRPK